MHRLLVVVTFLLAVVATACFGTEQFLETFHWTDPSEEFAQWLPIGNPTAVTILPYFGNPEPSFTCDGTWIGSKQTFDYTEGLVIEADVYVAGTTPAGRHSGIRFGLAVPDSSGLPSGYRSIFVQYAFSSDAWWPRQGSFLVRFFSDEGGQETYFVDYSQEPRANDYLGAWHTHRIVIAPDQSVQFYVGNDLIYEGMSRLDLSLSGGWLALGGENGTGLACLDNIRVLDYPLPQAFVEPTPKPFLRIVNIEQEGGHTVVEIKNIGDADCSGEAIIHVGLSYDTTWIPEWETQFHTVDLGYVSIPAGDSAVFEIEVPSTPQWAIDQLNDRLSRWWTGYTDRDPDRDYLGFLVSVGTEHCFGFIPDGG